MNYELGNYELGITNLFTEVRLRIREYFHISINQINQYSHSVNGFRRKALYGIHLVRNYELVYRR